MRSSPTKGASAGSVRSSTSKLMAHWRAKYSDGRSAMSGQKPPKDSACSSRRSSQKGAQPPEDSRKSEAQPRVALEHPEGDELGAGEHRLEGVGHRVQDERVEGAVGPERRHDRPSCPRGCRWARRAPRPRPTPRRRRGRRASGPGRGWAGRSRPRSRARSTARRSSPRRRRRVLQREHGRPEEPARVGGAVAGQPVVVGGGQGDRRRRVLHHREVQPDGRVQHGLVDALASMSRRRATGSDPPGWASASGRKVAGSSKVEPGRASVPSGTARISVSPTTTCS